MHIIHGSEGIKYLFEKTLNNNEKLLRTALSDKPLVYLAGEDFAEEYMNKRVDAKIFLQSLRFSGQEVDLPEHKNYALHNKETRIAPQEIQIDHSVIIWDDFVAIVDAINVSGTIIQDKGYANVMKQWFDFIWSKSE